MRGPGGGPVYQPLAGLIVFACSYSLQEEHEWRVRGPGRGQRFPPADCIPFSRVEASFFLQEEHERGGCVGLDVASGEPADPHLSGVLDNYIVKRQILQRWVIPRIVNFLSA